VVTRGGPSGPPLVTHRRARAASVLGIAVVWNVWHAAYDDEGSAISKRLVVVTSILSEVLEGRPPGQIVLASLCAGDARDVASVLAGHDRSGDVSGRVIESDHELALRARRRLDDAGAHSVDVVEGDAGLVGALDGLGPIGVMLACGVFGNVALDDVAVTIAAFAGLLATGGDVVWTRHRGAPDATPKIRSMFDRAGFDEVRFAPVDGTLAAVGHHRLGRRRRARLPVRMFEFAGDGGDAFC